MTRFFILATSAICVLACSLAACSSPPPEPANNGNPFYLANPTHNSYGSSVSDPDTTGMHTGMRGGGGGGTQGPGSMGGMPNGSSPGDPTGSNGSMSLGSGVGAGGSGQ